MVSVKITVDTQGLNKLNADIEYAVEQAGEDLAQEGKKYAKDIAPRYTSSLINLIGVYRIKKGKQTVFEIISKNPKGNRFWGDKEVKNFSLVKWMHETGGKFKKYPNPLRAVGKQHIRSGHPKYMYDMRDYLNKIKEGYVKGKILSRIKIR